MKCGGPMTKQEEKIQYDLEEAKNKIIVSLLPFLDVYVDNTAAIQVIEKEFNLLAISLTGESLEQ